MSWGKSTEPTITPLVTPTPSPTPTLPPTPTQTPAYSDAIIVMNNFFSWINDAGNKEDLRRSWDLETSGAYGLQCREAAGCEFSNFQDWWWQWNVQYKLYDCGFNIVDAELSYYSRDPLLATTPSTPIFMRHQLIDDHGQLKLNRVDYIEGSGADCHLTITAP